MTNKAKQFLKLVNERDKKMAEHCKDESWAELCNYPEERDWYSENIYPIDEKIIIVANDLIVLNGISCKSPKTIYDVYTNEEIIKVVKPNNKSQDDGLSK